MCIYMYWYNAAQIIMYPWRILTFSAKDTPNGGNVFAAPPAVKLPSKACLSSHCSF